MEIIDREATAGAPSSKFLNRSEVHMLYPEEMPRRRDYIFKYKVPLDIPVKEALVLVEKYPDALMNREVKQVQGGDSLETMTYGELKKLAHQTYRIPYRDTMVKRDSLIQLIREEKLNREKR